MCLIRLWEVLWESVHVSCQLCWMFYEKYSFSRSNVPHPWQCMSNFVETLCVLSQCVRGSAIVYAGESRGTHTSRDIRHDRADPRFLGPPQWPHVWVLSQVLWALQPTWSDCKALLILTWSPIRLLSGQTTSTMPFSLAVIIDRKQRLFPKPVLAFTITSLLCASESTAHDWKSQSLLPNSSSAFTITALLIWSRCIPGPCFKWVSLWGFDRTIIWLLWFSVHWSLYGL